MKAEFSQFDAARLRMPSAIAVVALVAALVSGCTGDGDPHGPNATENVTDATGSAEESTGDGGDTLTEQDLVNARGAASWLSGFTCAEGDGGVWSARGTLVNPGDAPATVLVTASVTDSGSNAVQGSRAEAYEVEAGATVEVVLDEVFVNTDGRSELTCVSRVVAGDSGS